MLEQAVRWGWLGRNPAARATPPRVVRAAVTPPEPADVMRLLAEADPDLACFLRVAAVTGARRGELCALHWSDLDATAGTLVISRSVVGRTNDDLSEKTTKTGTGRRIALDGDTLTMLTDHWARSVLRAAECGVDLAPSSYIFSPAPDGSRPWRPDGLTLAFGRLRKRVGLTGVRLHDLRHAAATQMLAAGVPVPIVSGRLGHASPTTTLSVYAHWIRAGDQAAAGVLGALLGRGIDNPASPPSSGVSGAGGSAGTRERRARSE